MKFMKLKRYKNNPILVPNKKNKWESKAVFNCAVILENGLIHLLYRAIGEYKNYISRIGYAISKDGINFKRKNNPILEPTEEYEKWGCEDPRITKIDNKFYITYVALCKPARKGGGPPRIALASTIDFINFKKHGIISPKGVDGRNCVLFPEKINGEYVMLHRPYNWIKEDTYKKNGKLYLKVKEKSIKWPMKEMPIFLKRPSIWIAYSQDLKNWHNHKMILKPERKWEMGRVGSGTPPIKTKAGWLLIYHGVGSEDSITKYKIGAALLDIKDPSKIIARTKNPILEPQKDYEVFGDVSNVVFPEGAIVIKEELFVYYGAADKTCCLATCKLKDLIDFLLYQN